MSSNYDSDGCPIDQDGFKLEDEVFSSAALFAIRGDIFREIMSGSGKDTGSSHLEVDAFGPVRQSSSGGIPLKDSVERVDGTEHVLVEDVDEGFESDEPLSPNRANMTHANSTITVVLRTTKFERDALYATRKKLNDALSFLRKQGFREEQIFEGLSQDGFMRKIPTRNDFGMPQMGAHPVDGELNAHKVFDTSSKQSDVPIQDPFVDKMKGVVPEAEAEHCVKMKEFEELPKPSPELNSNQTEVPKSWANVVKKDSPVVSFKFFPLGKGDSVVDPPIEVLKQGNEKFKHCVVGTFSKRTQPYKLVSKSAFHNWRSKGLVSVHQKDSSTYLFRFSNDTGVNSVLARGTWYVGRRPMILTAWGQKPGTTVITSMPLWVKLSNLPDCYWTEEGLSRIAGVIGEPLGADEPTSRLDVMPFAKMQVKYKLGDPLPNEIPVTVIDPISEERSVNKVQVSYPFRPLSCSGCHSLGHSIAACPAVIRVWQKKTSPPAHDESHKDPVSANGVSANCPAEDKSDIPPMENHWTEVKRKSQGSILGTISDSESPPIPNTFRNLKKVDEIDVKNGVPSLLFCCQNRLLLLLILSSFLNLKGRG